MKKTTYILGAIAAAALTVGCASTQLQSGFPSAEEVVKSSWHNVPEDMKGRLVQDEPQKICSAGRDNPSKETIARAEALAKAAPVVLPKNGNMMGDWKKGEASAQSGFGQRVGDATTRPNGGNCYACHQMTKKELSYGTLGPSLLGYGKVRGNSPAMVKYTYEKIYNPHIYSGCSNMPRFGHNGILTPEQIADAVALLLDPKSPVNQ
jgi:sulfur-oxidizing protein SoxX